MLKVKKDMRFLIIPLGLLHRGAEKILGRKELEELNSNLAVPVAEFADEVYSDIIGDAAKRLSRLSRRKGKKRITVNKNRFM